MVLVNFYLLVENFTYKQENILPCFKIFSHFQTKCTGGRIITDQEREEKKPCLNMFLN